MRTQAGTLLAANSLLRDIHGEKSAGENANSAITQKSGATVNDIGGYDWESRRVRNTKV